ncbi:hypothetical protein C3L33_08321, partial [Rhododendron williamsianum]
MNQKKLLTLQIDLLWMSWAFDSLCLSDSVLVFNSTDVLLKSRPLLGSINGTINLFDINNPGLSSIRAQLVCLASEHFFRREASRALRAHGVLNVVSWGIMMPLGFMAARYLKALGPRADPLWFYTHVSLQLSGNFLGMAGGATELVLGSMSSGNHHLCHMGIGITLFSLGLLQFQPALAVSSFFSAPSLALSVAGGSSCSDSVFPNNQVFASCTDLPNLDSFLHWTYTPSSSTLHIAYRHSQVSSSTWVAWGINPTSKGMIGTQAILAYPKPDGTVAVFTSPVDSYGTRLREGNLTFAVSDLSAMFMDNEMVIFATIELPENTTSVDHVWQDGPVSGDNLGMHGAHGVLNAVSWGIMMPLGFMAARYLKALRPRANPLWFYTQYLFSSLAIFLACREAQLGLFLVACHLEIIILATWVLGVHFLPSDYFRFLLYFCDLQRTTSTDIFGIGSTISRLLSSFLSLVNIWVGFTILKPAKGWMIGYGSISSAIMLTSLILEVWKKMTRDGRSMEHKSMHLPQVQKTKSRS